MGRRVVISFNCQLLKARRSFQKVTPGEEEVSKESNFHHEPDVGEATTGLMPLEKISFTA